MTRATAPEALFWRLAETRLGNDGVERGTIMSSSCLRRNGEFCAMFARRDAALVVKLPRQRVDELIAIGVGGPFAPAGRIFREWLAVKTIDEDLWLALLDESIDFAGSAGGAAS